MYQIPGTVSEFDLEHYFRSVTDLYDHVDPCWPILKSEVDRKQLEILLGGIEKSVSLDLIEKRRIFNTKLSEFQSNQLVEVFKDEESELKRLVEDESEYIFDMAVKAHHDWIDHLLPELLGLVARGDDDGGTPEFPLEDVYLQ